MFIEIDFESDLPIYTQIYNQVIKGVSKGELADGEELPSVRQMSSDIGVDKNTVIKAYNLLKQDGIIAMHRRKGAVIASKEKRTMTEMMQKKLAEELEVFIATGLCFQLSKAEILQMVEKVMSEY